MGWVWEPQREIWTITEKPQQGKCQQEGRTLEQHPRDQSPTPRQAVGARVGGLVSSGCVCWKERLLGGFQYIFWWSQGKRHSLSVSCPTCRSFSSPRGYPQGFLKTTIREQIAKTTEITWSRTSWGRTAAPKCGPWMSGTRPSSSGSLELETGPQHRFNRNKLP